MKDELRIEVPDGMKLGKPIRRKTNRSDTIIVTVNKDTKIVEIDAAPPPPIVSKILFSSAMTESQSPDDVWQEVTRPSVNGVVQMDRIRAVTEADTPGTGDPRKPKGPTMRVELRHGDEQTGGSGYVANRAEAYARHAVPGSLPASEWPDPPGSTRFYGMSIFIPGDFAIHSGVGWRVVAQWKGYRSGSPPIALEVARGNFEIGSSVGGRLQMPGLVRGAWHNIVFKILHSPDPKIGRLAVWINSVNVVEEYARATMAMVGGSIDPGYFKNGDYRSGAIVEPDVLHYGPSVVATTIEAVDDYMK